MPRSPHEHRDRHLLRTYGITLARYDSLLTKQGGVCAICGERNKVYGRHRKESLCVDHDHKTGKVRGLLCHKCNRTLGNIRDNPEILQRLIDYLAKEKPMSSYMDNNVEAADSRSNSAKMNVENPYQYNHISSPVVMPGAVLGGTAPNAGSTNSELTYTDDNSNPETAMGNQADSTAKNTNTFVHLTPADASPNDPKNFSVDDFLCVNYAHGVASPARPNAQGLYGKGAK